jgi:hypothetical protein
MKLFELFEALKPSEYRAFLKGYAGTEKVFEPGYKKADKSFREEYKNRYSNIFGNRYRIFIPLVEKDVSIKDYIDYELLAKKLSSINVRLGAEVSVVDGKKVKTGGKIIKNYEGLVEIFRELEYTLKKNGYKFVDYMQGLATKDEKNNVNIGKLLASYPELKQFYDLDPVRQSVTKKQEVCISRHPYDVAGMTTGRGWSNESCMNIDSKNGGKYLPVDVKAGTLVAYLIDATLKDANGNPVGKTGRKIEPLKSPTARILIKPFVKLDNGKMTKDSEVVFGVEGKIYGAAGVTSFMDTVVKWADAINNSQELEGAYYLFPGLYSDDIEDTKHYAKKSTVSSGGLLLGNFQGKKLFLAPRVSDNLLDWYEAEPYCKSLGTGWHLPSKEIMDYVYDNRSKLGPDYSFSHHDYYWTSTTEDDEAWLIHMEDGRSSSDFKFHECYVRAVKLV